MDVYTTDEQQLETLRKWWNSNGSSVLLGAVLGISLIVGFKYFQSWQKNKGEHASDAYEEVVKLANDASKAADFKAKAIALTTDFKGTVYAEFAKLFLARDAVKANDLAAADQYLSQVVAEASDKSLIHVATLRLARVKMAENQADAALALVQKDKKDLGDFAGVYALARGQALLKLNREADAHAAFEEATLDKEMAAAYPELTLLVDSSAQASLVDETK